MVRTGVERGGRGGRGVGSGAELHWTGARSEQHPLL